MSYVGFGAAAFGQEDCPGQEVWDATIGACMCPPGTAPDAMSTGKCISPAASQQSFKKWRQQAGPCKPYTTGQKNCLCPNGTAYDAAKDMCTKERLEWGYTLPGVVKPCPQGQVFDAWELKCVSAGGTQKPPPPPPPVIEPPVTPPVVPTKKATIFGLPAVAVIAGVAGVGLLALAAAKKRKGRR